MSTTVYCCARSNFRDYNKSHGKDNTFYTNLEELVVGVLNCLSGVALMENDFEFTMDTIDVYEGIITDKNKAKFIKSYEFTIPEEMKMKSENYRDFISIYGKC